MQSEASAAAAALALGIEWDDRPQRQQAGNHLRYRYALDSRQGTWLRQSDAVRPMTTDKLAFGKIGDVITTSSVLHWAWYLAACLYLAAALAAG